MATMVPDAGNEERAALVGWATAVLLAEVAMMNAENAQRSHLSQAMAYADTDYTTAIADAWARCPHPDETTEEFYKRCAL